MISSSIGTAYVEDEKDRTYLQTLYANWGTVLTMALVVVWGGIYVFLFLVVHVTYEQTNTFVGIVVPFLVLLGMLLWSFFLTSLTSPRPIPLQYKLTDVEWEAFERLVESPSTQEEFVSRLVSERQLFMMGPNRQINVCRSCRQLKPDRTHHCRRCKMCVMRMDHHCPWFNNCIHFHNYHSFFCTLFYTGLTFAYVVVTVLLFYTIKFKWQLSSLAYYEPVLILVAVSTLCCLMVMSFFFYHMYLSAKNRTHIENLSSDQKQ
ncbi:putative palmitoyltransferase ZDHHC20 isoform X2-like, partial [Tropilaelaps mercedesae]